MTFVLRPETADDLEEARSWYENQRNGLGGEFLEQVEIVFQRIENPPEHFPRIHGELRRALVRRFPYAAYFVCEPARIVVVGVLHQRRDPASWQRRMPR